MKKRSILALVLCAGLLFSGCVRVAFDKEIDLNSVKEESQKEESSKKTDLSAKEESSKKAEKGNSAQDTAKVIGTKSDNAAEIQLKNETGKTISGLAIRNSGDESFGKNLLDGKKAIQNKEERTWYVDGFKRLSGKTFGKIDLEVTFEDGMKVVLHELSPDQILKASIQLEGEVGYLAWSGEDKKTVKTLERELQILEQETLAELNEEIWTGEMEEWVPEEEIWEGPEYGELGEDNGEGGCIQGGIFNEGGDESMQEFDDGGCTQGGIFNEGGEESGITSFDDGF